MSRLQQGHAHSRSGIARQNVPRAGDFANMRMPNQSGHGPANKLSSPRPSVFASALNRALGKPRDGQGARSGSQIRVRQPASIRTSRRPDEKNGLCSAFPM